MLRGEHYMPIIQKGIKQSKLKMFNYFTDYKAYKNKHKQTVR